jgi:hypothetical protein
MPVENDWPAPRLPGGRAFHQLPVLFEIVSAAPLIAP